MIDSKTALCHKSNSVQFLWWALFASAFWNAPYCIALQRLPTPGISRPNVHTALGTNRITSMKEFKRNIQTLPGLYLSSPSRQNSLQRCDFVQPDYLITDSEELEERPSLLQFLVQPRNLLGVGVVAVGFILTIYNVVGLYNGTYVSWERACVALGLLSGISDLSSVRYANGGDVSNPTISVSPNTRLGMADDALLHAYAGFYTVASAWLACRASPGAPSWLFGWDPVLGVTSTVVFMFSLIMPTITLLHHHDVVSIQEKLQSVVGVFRWNQKKTPQSQADDPLTLTETELLRVRSLLIIGAIGSVFAPIAFSFALGSQEWWGRVTTLHPSQPYLESTTELYGVLATQASMISHRAAKAGVAPLQQIVPFFTLVCFILAVLPCVCSLYWLGNDISFFSFYRE